MKKTIIVLIALGLLINLNYTMADESETISALENINLDEKPGILPDHPFYFAKTWGEKIKETFIFNEVKKEEYKLKLAERRLAEAKKLVEKNKPEKVEEFVKKYYQSLEKVNLKVAKLQKENKNVEELVEKLEAKTVQHQQVLAGVLKKVPETAKSAIEKAMEVSQNGHDTAIEAIQKMKQEVTDKVKIEKFKGLLDTAQENAKVFEAVPGQFEKVQLKDVQDSETKTLEKSFEFLELQTDTILDPNTIPVE